MVATVDTATCWGIIHVRRQAWVEVEPALCDSVVCGILTPSTEKNPGKEVGRTHSEGRGVSVMRIH